MGPGLTQTLALNKAIQECLLQAACSSHLPFLQPPMCTSRILTDEGPG